ncbi:hypothetical protein ACFZAM_02870 [Streptomyces sp. NPDC008079]|uniref:hypothetical protein n=1 Tax=Streptomyces sp. NPDC008079 TaxID=3364806 RepID=UPI0036EC0FDE
MNGRDRGRLYVASARPGPAVRAVLVIRLNVDSHRTARLPRRWLGAYPLPAGTNCRIDVGSARYYLSLWNELPDLVQHCASVEVVGTEPEGIEAVRRELTKVANAGSCLA